MEATERQVHMVTQTDGPVKPAHTPRCSHPHRLWGGSAITHVCYSIKGSDCFQSLVEPTYWNQLDFYESHWLCIYFHLLLKQTSVSKAAALIAAVPDHQLESDTVAISSQQSGAIICRCWHFKKCSCCCFFFFFLPLVVCLAPFYLTPDHPSAAPLWPEPFRFVRHSCMHRLAFETESSSSMLLGAVGGSLGCRHWIYFQSERSATWWDFPERR